MKRFTASWTTAIAASALLAMPVGSGAQQPTPSTTPGQTTGAPAPQTGRTPGAEMKQGAANEHLRQAQSALADIPETSLTGTAKTRVAELKRHLNALEKAAQKPASGTSARSSWSGDAAAADRILSELLDPASATGATTPAPAGTTGSTVTAPKTTTGGKSSASMALDDTARTKLQEVRTHITAFAAAMGAGSTSNPKSPSTSSDDPSSSASASAASTAGSAPSTAGTAGTTAPAPTGTSGTATAPAEPVTRATPPDLPASAATQEQPPAQPPAEPTQPPTATPTTPSPTPSQQVDAETVKRHLTAARDTLSQLTQLPGAAQLTGDARTQVSQLISNFNELITTNVDWRAAYGKLQTNLTALVGEQRTDESPAPAAGAAGAVGTSGTVTLDPAIRAKLIEFRSHLAEFEKAAGGGSGTPADKDPTAQPAPSPAASASPASSAGASAPTDASSTPSATTTTSTTASPAGGTTASPAPAATTGSTSATPGAAGTSGTGTPMPAASEQSTKPSTTGRDSAQAAEGHRAAMKHIEAIEAILNGASPAGTSGATAAKTTKPGTLERAQIEEIRNHLAQLRKELEKSNR